MLKKLHPNNLRYFILTLNLVLTFVVTWSGLWLFGFNRIFALEPLRVEGFKRVEDIETYCIPDISFACEVGGRPARIAGFFNPQKKDEEYRVLKLKAVIAPIKVGVFPLVSDERLVKIAKIIDKDLRNAGISTYYDEGGTIGRRYARMDEIGTPFCVTVDHDSLDDKKVTVRDRDTTEQKREKVGDLILFFKEKI